jgi:hypothetical protein
LEIKMADPISSSDRIASEFMANGRPAGGADEGGKSTVLGGFAVKTPQVGDGFAEWAISGYNLEGTHSQATGKENYDKSGDWAYDRQTVEQGKDQRYIPEHKANQK